MRNASRIAFIVLVWFLTTAGLKTEGGLTYPVTVISWAPFYIYPQIPSNIDHRPSDVYEISMWQLYTNYTPSYALNGIESAIIERRITTSEDDAEEQPNGSMSFTSSDLELVQDSNIQKIGLRFLNVNIPVNSTITNAYIEFETDETSSIETNLSIKASPDIVPFDTKNLSSRTTGNVSVSWNPGAWTIVNEKHRTPNITSLLQEVIVNNTIVIIITGTGTRIAESYDGESASAALLHIEYTTGTGTHKLGDWIPFDQNYGGGNSPYQQTIWKRSENALYDAGITWKDKWLDKWAMVPVFPGYIGVLPITVKWEMKNTRTQEQWELFKLVQTGYIDCTNLVDGKCVGISEDLMPPDPPVMNLL